MCGCVYLVPSDCVWCGVDGWCGGFVCVVKTHSRTDVHAHIWEFRVMKSNRAEHVRTTHVRALPPSFFDQPNTIFISIEHYYLCFSDLQYFAMGELRCGWIQLLNISTSSEILHLVVPRCFLFLFPCFLLCQRNRHDLCCVDHDVYVCVCAAHISRT